MGRRRPRPGVTSLNSGRLYVRPLAAGTGAPVVLLHGFSGDADAWSPLVESGGLAGRTLVAVDLPGHGRSPDPRGGIRAAAADVLAAARPWLPAHWVGYSMGGRVALTVATLEPGACLSLALVGTSVGIRARTERQARRDADERWARLLEDEGLETFIERWLAQPLFATLADLPAAAAADLKGQRLRQRPEGLAAAMRSLGAGAMPWLGGRLPALPMPVLWLAGALDEKYAAQAQANAGRSPRGECAIVPGAGHNLVAEAPQALAAMLAGFLPEENQA